jgi:hypothetical protein
MMACSTERSGEVGPRQEIRDQRALTVYNRVRDKLAGKSTERLDRLFVYAVNKGAILIRRNRSLRKIKCSD